MSGRSRSEAVAGAQSLSGRAPAIYFELERFERGEGERLELTGRWFGIRGRRFVRPTLTVVTDGDRVRALADLEHKPWAADDGEPWQAAFTWRGQGDVAAAELAVAPDLAVELPPLGTSLDPRQRLVPLPRQPASEKSSAAEPRAAEPEPEPDSAPAPSPGRRRAAGSAELERLKAEVEELRDQVQSSDSQLKAAQSERDELAVALESARATVEELRRGAARAAQAEEEDRRTAGELDGAIAARDRALAERRRALGERDVAIGQRDQAVLQRDEALRARDRLATERDQAVAAHAAGLVMRDAVRSSSPFRHERSWAARLVAIAVLVGALIACAVVLRVL